MHTETRGPAHKLGSVLDSNAWWDLQSSRAALQAGNAALEQAEGGCSGVTPSVHKACHSQNSWICSTLFLCIRIPPMLEDSQPALRASTGITETMPWGAWALAELAALELRAHSPGVHLGQMEHQATQLLPLNRNIQVSSSQHQLQPLPFSLSFRASRLRGSKASVDPKPP